MSALIKSTAGGILLGAAWFPIFLACQSGPAHGFDLFLAGFIALPYALCALILFLQRESPWVPFCSVVAALAWEGFTAYSVLIAPSSSTAAIAYVFSPVINTFVFVPAGLVLGAIVTALARRRSPPNNSSKPTPLRGAA